LYSITDTNESFNAFFHTFYILFDKCFPFVKIPHSQFMHKKWMTAGLLKSIHHKNALYKQWLKTKDPSLKAKYLSYAKLLNKLCFMCKKEFFNNSLSMKCNSVKEIWRTLNSMCIKSKTSNNSSITKIQHNGNDVTDKASISDVFNNYFANIGVNLSRNIPSTADSFVKYLKAPSRNTFFFSNISEQDIVSSISMLKNTFSAGPDSVPGPVIKYVKFLIATLLAHIFNLSCTTGIFPDGLKLARVTPIFKKGSMTDISNYRPISLLNSFSKLFEKIIHAKLVKFFNKYNILHKNQFGFRKGHSTVHALIQAVNYIFTELSKKNYVMGLFFDLSKSFDTCNHDILLYKLEHCGIRGSMLNWFRSYLSNRHQYVVVNGTKSNIHPIVCGVPQGSVLGPLLFLIYVNDIFSIYDFDNLVLFADDSNVFAVEKSIGSLFIKANNICNKLNTWFNANKLTINIEKSHYMIFKPTEVINENVIDNNMQVKFNSVVIPRINENNIFRLNCG